MMRLLFRTTPFPRSWLSVVAAPEKSEIQPLVNGRLTSSIEKILSNNGMRPAQPLSPSAQHGSGHYHRESHWDGPAHEEAPYHSHHAPRLPREGGYHVYCLSLKM